MRCPRCDSEVGWAQPATDLQCACGHLFTALAPTDVIWEPRAVTASPPHIGVQTFPDHITEVTIPWRREWRIYHHLMLMVPAWALLLLALTGTMGPLSGPFGVAFLTVWAYYMVNKTVVTVGPGRLEVTHGPMLSLLDRSIALPANQIRPVVLETSIFENRGSVTKYYSVEMADPTHSQHATVLLRKFSDPAVPTYIRDLIQGTIPQATGHVAHPAGSQASLDVATS